MLADLLKEICSVFWSLLLHWKLASAFPTQFTVWHEGLEEISKYAWWKSMSTKQWKSERIF